MIAIQVSDGAAPPPVEVPYAVLYDILVTMTLLGPTHDIARAALALQVALVECYGRPPHLGEIQ
jgi:hypothetical protein